MSKLKVIQCQGEGQGGIGNKRKDCEYRHDNGNCLKVGGFCTAVDNKHCEKLNHGSVADDVCEWKLEGDNLMTGCGDYFNLYDNCTGKFKYCPVCGKYKGGGVDG